MANRGKGRSAASRRTARTIGSGRTTPKGAAPGGRPTQSSRYTPPVPKAEKVSPRWVPVLMFLFLTLGAVIIVTNYLGLLPTESGDASNWWLLGGLGCITAGFVTATQYH